MDANNVKQDLDRLVKGFTSLDPNEFDSAINEFFKVDAAIDSSILKIKGSGRIREFTAFQAQLADSNQVVGKPSYDDKKQVVDFDFKRQFKNPPVLPSLPILSSFFAGQKSWYPCHAQMHLQSEGSSGDKRMYVSKIAVKEKPQPPVINFVMYYLLRPFFSLLAIAISHASSFYYRHIKDTWAQFFFAAINETLQGIWSILLREQHNRAPQVDKWRQTKGEDLKNLIGQAKSTALDGASQVELRLRNAGVPIDQYKKQAGEVAQDLQNRVQEAASYLEQNADKAKKQASNVQEEGKKQLNNAKDEAQKQANNVQEEGKKQLDNAKDQAQTQGNNVQEEGKKQLDGAKDQAQKKADSVQDEGKKQVDNAKTEAQKQTKSQGNGDGKKTDEHKGNGSKKQAKESKTQAQPAQSHHEAFPNDDVSPDDVPTTPLGGHDPTAPNAFSYAHAAEL